MIIGGYRKVCNGCMLNLYKSNDWRKSLVPAPAVIPAPIAYSKIVAIKTLVVIPFVWLWVIGDLAGIKLLLFIVFWYWALSPRQEALGFYLPLCNHLRCGKAEVVIQEERPNPTVSKSKWSIQALYSGSPRDRLNDLAWYWVHVRKDNKRKTGGGFMYCIARGEIQRSIQD